MLTLLLLHFDNPEAERVVTLFFAQEFTEYNSSKKIVVTEFRYVHSMKVICNIPPKASKCRKM